jgi:His/Glu/Gln/Arg/opine family amino acid ABC transporter permease subunit
MNELGPLIHSFWYLLRGAGMTVLMAASAVVPATFLGILLALSSVFGSRLMRSAIVGYLFLVRGIPLLVLLTFVYYLMPLTGIDLPRINPPSAGPEAVRRGRGSLERLNLTGGNRKTARVPVSIKLIRPQNYGAVVKTLLATRSSEDDPRVLRFFNGFCL